MATHHQHRQAWDGVQALWIPSSMAPFSSCPQSLPTSEDPPGSSVHGILQARILEWVVISFSREWYVYVKLNLSFGKFFFKAREWGLFAFVGCFCLFVCLFSIYFIWLHRVFIAKRHVGSQFPYRRLNLHPLQILNHWTTREAPGGS